MEGDQPGQNASRGHPHSGYADGTDHQRGEGQAAGKTILPSRFQQHIGRLLFRAQGSVVVAVSGHGMPPGSWAGEMSTRSEDAVWNAEPARPKFVLRGNDIQFSGKAAPSRY